MHLVGKVMNLTNRTGDPVIIKSLIEDIVNAKADKYREGEKRSDSSE